MKGYEIPEDVILFLAQNISSNIIAPMASLHHTAVCIVVRTAYSFYTPNMFPSPSRIELTVSSFIFGSSSPCSPA